MLYSVPFTKESFMTSNCWLLLILYKYGASLCEWDAKLTPNAYGCFLSKVNQKCRDKMEETFILKVEREESPVLEAQMGLEYADEERFKY